MFVTGSHPGDVYSMILLLGVSLFTSLKHLSNHGKIWKDPSKTRSVLNRVKPYNLRFVDIAHHTEC